MFQIAIYEKKKDSQEYLKDYIASNMDINDSYTLECFSSFDIICQRIREKDFTFDLLLLGMAGQDAECMEILEMTKKFLPELDIMLIADDMGFLSDALKYHVFSYMLRPLSHEKFDREMQDYFQKKRQYQGEFLSVQIQGSEHMLSLKSIHYLSSRKRKICVSFSGAREDLWFYGNLSTLEEQLKQFGFIRCHQSFLVNGRKVERITSKVIYTDEGEFPITRKYKKPVLEQWEKMKESVFDKKKWGTPFREKKTVEVDKDNKTSLIITENYTLERLHYGIIIALRGLPHDVVYRIFDQDEICIGRNDRECGIVVDDDKVSRLHCRIRFDSARQRYFVKDESRNGTYVGGVGRLTPGSWMEVERDTSVDLVDGRCTFILV